MLISYRQDELKLHYYVLFIYFIENDLKLWNANKMCEPPDLCNDKNYIPMQLNCTHKCVFTANVMIMMW